jgi:hypothetical protein
MICILGFSFVMLNAQIKVATNNNVGIATTNPLSILSVNSDGNAQYNAYFYGSGTEKTVRFQQDNPTGTNYNHNLVASVGNISTGFKNIALMAGIYQSSVHSKRCFGLYANAGNGYSGYNYAVYGTLLGDRNGAGIVGVVGTAEPTIDGKYAGYFAGNVKTTGTLWTYDCIETSDERLKTNIRSISSALDEQTHLRNLLTLSAIKYNLRSPAEYADYSISDTLTTEDFEPAHLKEQYTRERIGLSAQEIRELYPELVVEDSQGYLGVDYNGMIPILIEAIKEQQHYIEDLQADMEYLKAKLEKAGELTTE